MGGGNVLFVGEETEDHDPQLDGQVLHIILGKIISFEPHDPFSGFDGIISEL